MIDRINLILQAKNITARQFAEEVGIQPSGMSHILSGRNNPSLDFVMKVINRYPEIDINWLLFGKGAMYITSENTPSKPISHDSSTIVVEENKNVSEGVDDVPNLFSNLGEEEPENNSVMVSSKNNMEMEPSMVTPQNASAEEGKISNKNYCPQDAIDTLQTPIKTKIEPINSSVRDCRVMNKKLVKVVLFYDDHSFAEYVAE